MKKLSCNSVELYQIFRTGFFWSERIIFIVVLLYPVKDVNLVVYK
jgi:hypothetical protein